MALHEREFHYRWQWELEADVEALWPLVSDTNRFDADTGLPALEEAPGGRMENARIRARLFRFGVPLEYVQDPFEWIRPFRFGVVRHFASGPVAELRVLAELTPRPDGGTILTYQTWAQPANPLGLAAIPFQIGLLSRRSFERVFRAYDRLAAAGRSFFDREATAVTFAPGGRGRLRALHGELCRQADDPALADRLVQFLETADPLSLQRLRPYALANYWQLPRRALLELCLLATRVGILEFRWDLLCPLCRDSKASYTTLGLVEPAVHCETCNINFEANFERSVELTFRPSQAIRPIGDSVFCINAPQKTPHVAVQQLLAPGETRTVTPILETGRHRVRALELPGGRHLRVVEDGREEVRLRATGEGWPGSGW